MNFFKVKKGKIKKATLAIWVIFPVNGFILKTYIFKKI